MVSFLSVLLFLAVSGLIVLAVVRAVEKSNHTKALLERETARVAAVKRAGDLRDENEKVRAEIARVAPWTSVADADETAKRMVAEGQQALGMAQDNARIVLENAQRDYHETLANATSDAEAATKEERAKGRAAREEAEAVSQTAVRRSEEIVAAAESKAREIAGNAYDALENADAYQRTVIAMKNIIEGYGDEYLKPAENLLDDLADDFSHKEAGRELKRVRSHTKAMIKDGLASRCDYVEKNRREMAERFVLDAFNGKVDSTLSRVKHDNVGKLEQEILDAFTVVNFNGKAFRDARITDEFHASRLEELKWGATAQELKRQEQEEQRRIREQIREEEKARRDYERAIKEVQKEEKMLRKAMEKAEAKVASATAEQRALFEAELETMRGKLMEAEERGQRAVSMAQQTRRGYVYIISNIGSFGDGIYKIGLTRRLEPMDRVKELGDASVPFEFDVHAMILSDDAPALETRLHKHFLLSQVNKVNHRKEFFRVPLEDIKSNLDELGLETKWTMLSEAAQYRESMTIEKAIADDPMAREAWCNRQLTLDPVDYAFAGSAEEN